MKRRKFIKDAVFSASAACCPSTFHEPEILQQLLGTQQGVPVLGRQQIQDLAQYEEAQHPLLAGRFEEALKILIPAMKQRPGEIPYTIAAIYLRMERWAEGIPYALQACRDTPSDLRYKWILRALAMHAGQPESIIPSEFRLKLPPA